ncbi:MAG: lipopolysaccharide/colanic/teichoic acid biosynthesis glycosyltransferase, partial [Myxococcota bacterium]
MKINKPRVVVGSCVGGGPMERLAREFEHRGIAAEVFSAYAPKRWRERMNSGRTGRIRARLASFTRFPLQLAWRAMQDDSPVIVPTTNPFILPMVLIATRPIHGRPVVPLVYDLYPDALEAGGVASANGWVARTAEAANRWWFPQADGVVFIGHRMAAHARQRYGEPSRWAVIETGADAAELDPPTLRTAAQSDLERWCDDRFVVAYVGNLGHVHDVETLQAGVLELAQRHNNFRINSGTSAVSLGILIAGSGPGVETLRKAFTGLPNDAVRFEPPLADAEWARLLARTHLSVVTLKERANKTCIPSKALSAIAAGSALLAVAPADSDLADLIADHSCGVRVAPGDVDGFVASIETLVQDPVRLNALRESARHAAITHFDIVALAERWEELLESIGPTTDPGPIYRAAKRALDVVAAAGAIAVTSPLLIGGALAIRMTMGSPVLFRQKRPGKDGVEFELKKFRTMRHAKSDETGPESDAGRLTRVGQFLRSTSIDELPTLLNVLAGDMSLVGPRPLLVRYLARYSSEQARRHEVPPGVTGY